MSLPVERAKQAVANTRVRPMSAQVAEVRNNINLIQEALKATMKKDVHYGIIPGTQKPTLYKAGAEVIMALFRLSADMEVNDLSKDTGEIRYQVKVALKTREGVFVGSGIGECSTQEEKYSWRASLCQEEFDATPENLKRIKFRKGFNGGAVQQIQQIRVNPSELANTILKMAKKRGLIDAVLTTTAASDCFAQDIEDLPDGFVDAQIVPQAPVEAPKTQQNAPASPVSQPQPPSEPPAPDVSLISEPQRKRLFAIAMASGMTKDVFKDWLSRKFGIESSTAVPKAEYDRICAEAEKYNPIGG